MSERERTVERDEKKKKHEDDDRRAMVAGVGIPKKNNRRPESVSVMLFQHVGISCVGSRELSPYFCFTTMFHDFYFLFFSSPVEDEKSNSFVSFRMPPSFT
jgi:hypothetical protein